MRSAMAAATAIAPRLVAGSRERIWVWSQRMPARDRASIVARVG
ncbi:unnamed protein product [Gemmataceae bacterium]|nr:unnamed protein product [Gemmataceae bacterium]VTT97327.1 unnamed protein product [Gemmataceae bacterium]